MPQLANYHYFAGRHWETGSVHNHFAQRRFHAPHTNQPYSEALLLGISGGIVMGYFSFAYAGYDPHVAILVRNTFDPLDALLTRLGVEQTLLQSTNAKKAAQNLIESLKDGVAPIVWADQYSLSYNALPHDGGMWQMAPLVVFGYDETSDTVSIADRASVALTTSVAEFDAARGRVKQDRYKLLTLEAPDPDKLPAAVSAGIWSCINLFTEKPPKGSRDNFGFAAYRRWAELLTKPNQRLSWEKEFPAGRKMLAGLTSAFNMIALFGQAGVTLDAERGLYADFLDEAAVLLHKPALHPVATYFLASAHAWHAFAHHLLPDNVAPFHEIRQLMVQRQRAFIDRGNAALEEMRAIDQRIAALRQACDADFPLTPGEVTEFRAALAEELLHICRLEQSAIDLLKEAMY